MCGIAGVINLSSLPIRSLDRALSVMNSLQVHRGPDGEGVWKHRAEFVGFAHRRLAIIDLVTGNQPLADEAGNCIIFNGEIYNYLELRDELGRAQFVTSSDTEVILRAYRKWGTGCLEHFRGMFSFAIWDEQKETLFCARDRFGIKPFYYTIAGGQMYFASEVKALLPFVGTIETDLDGLQDYIAFQFYLGGKTLFKDVRELPPGNMITVSGGTPRVERYWEIYYRPDFYHTESYFEDELRSVLSQSIELHMRSDVPVGAYVSGGVDSSAVASLASRLSKNDFIGFTGRFPLGPHYDESAYAELVAKAGGFPLHTIDITVDDFVNSLRRVIYHLDYPLAGPGSFPQFMVSQLAAKHRKVVLGGQGGDEIFGGYTRYLIAYFEQCIKAAIEGTMHNGNFIVTYESIIPNLATLKQYKPLLQDFWRVGLFDDIDKRYFRLINRTSVSAAEVNWSELGDYSPYETFRALFQSGNVGKESYFDLMTHFDFQTLLPALLHVEDRVSMAHGLESRVPLLDHPLAQLAATMPSNIKFKDGELKHIFRNAIADCVPEEVWKRKDKMGFPVPLTEWITGDAKEFVCDIFSSQAACARVLIDNRKVLANLQNEPKFSRKIWGFLCLELWHQEFIDQQSKFKGLMPSEESSV